eukprot:scaffold1740_cov254-Pinguiococcus_pyrenoidosus.AAC.4
MALWSRHNAVALITCVLLGKSIGGNAELQVHPKTAGDLLAAPIAGQNKAIFEPAGIAIKCNLRRGKYVTTSSTFRGDVVAKDVALFGAWTSARTASRAVQSCSPA